MSIAGGMAARRKTWHRIFVPCYFMPAAECGGHVDTVQTSLVRHLSRWDLTALVVNGIIGSGIFGLPAIIITLTGAASPLAYLVAAAGTAVVIVCFAEASALFSDAGGPYLYAREAFGPFVGLQIGWIA